MNTKNLTNEIITGTHRAELMILPVETSLDRTATILSVAKAIAIDKEIPMAIFSLELSNARLAAHLLADSAQRDVVETLESKQAKGQLQQIIDAIQKKPLYLDDSSFLSAEGLKEKAAKLLKDHGVRVILVDYLELMDAYDENSLNAIAQELGVSLIVLSVK